ncbi:MAG: T9SS type A sorting domain-containing protein [Bacteroidetes bacterium]|nr:T9SS type A sorting domain-containing protein [Bacteroidota bacterium]
MKIFSFTALFLLAFQFLLFAQQPPFSQANVTLPQLAYSACAWGDFDHDGDLDLALTGAEGNNPLTKIFRNDNGVFTDIQASLLALHFGSAEWGDYDNDGDLDLLVTGIESLGNPHTIIFKNTGGTFTDSGILLPGVMDGQATWGDLDNDGNLDILLAGSSMARIYRNNGNGTFTDINAPLPNVETAMCCWNDYNNDGQMDVLVCGDTGGGIVSALFKNDHGIFTEVTTGPEPFTGLYGGEAKWADLDNDGDQDLVIAGMDLYVDGYFLIYRNDGNGQFTKFAENSANLLNPTFDLGDYDGDGLPDIVLIGTISGCGGSAITMLMQNLGFVSFLNVSSLLPGFKLGDASWGDYNNDGYSDLLFTGLDAFESPKTALYLNNLGDTSVFVSNTPPTVPQELHATIEPGKAILHWGSASDAQTPKDALSYNIRIGTLPDAYDIFSPLALLYTGQRTITAPGNASADTNWMISGIASGTYYFSVQAIDNGFMPGPFSAPCMFSFAPVGVELVPAQGFGISPNPCRDVMKIHNGGQAGQDFNVRISDRAGQMRFQGVNPTEVDISSWPSGIYFLQKTDSMETLSVKFIKN